MAEYKSRIAWRSSRTDSAGHGEYMSEKVAKAWLAQAEKKFGKDIEHCLEPEPEPEPEPAPTTTK